MRIYLLLVEKIIEILAALATFLLARYLYGLSTPEYDLRQVDLWLAKHGLYALKWYRGLEYLHQIRGRRIIEHSITPR